MAFLSFAFACIAMFNDNRGSTSDDEKRLAQIIAGTGTPAEEKEEERARKKGHNR
jgi:hypothetical protein